MDGFNVIPVDKSIYRPANANNTQEPQTSSVGVNSNFGIEIVDEEAEKNKPKEGGGVFLLISVLLLLFSFAYFGFLIFKRVNSLNKITDYSNQLHELGLSIDKVEMEEFKNMEKSLKFMNGKMANHILNSGIFIFINNNIRNNLQVTDYKIDVKDKTVEADLSSVSPTLKDLTEQSEKLYILKQSGSIKDFNIYNISIEPDTKRVRSSMKLVFEKTKVSAQGFDLPLNKEVN